MAAYDNKKLLEAILKLDLVSDKPSFDPGSSQSFAQYMTEYAIGVPNKANSAAAIGAASQDRDERGALGKTFGWLASLGTGVENVMTDMMEFRQASEAGEDPSFLGLAGDIGKHAGAAVGTFLSPLAEIPMIPGVEVPGEQKFNDSVGKWLRENNYYRDGKPVFGARLVESSDWWKRKEAQEESDIAEFTSKYGANPHFDKLTRTDSVGDLLLKYGVGLGIDVASDPLTYTGLGFLKYLNPKKYGAGGGAQHALEQAAAAVKGSGGPSAKAETALQSIETAPSALRKTQSEKPLDFGKFETLTQIPGKFNAPSKIQSPSPGTIFPVGAPAAVKSSVPDLKIPDFQRWHGLQRNSEQVLNKKGINPFVVAKAIDDAHFDPSIAKAAPATGSSANRAIQTTDSFISRLKNAKKPKMTPMVQAKLWDDLYKSTADEAKTLFPGSKMNSSKVVQWRKSETLRKLRTSEDHIRGRYGVFGEHWSGSGLRLSDVLAEVNKTNRAADLSKVVAAFKQSDPASIADPVIKNAIERAIGRRSSVTGPVAKVLYDNFAPAAKVELSNLSPVKYEKWLKGEVEKATYQAKMLGLTDKEAAAVAETLKRHTGLDELDQVDIWHVIDQITPVVAKAVLLNKLDQKALNAVHKQVRRYVDSQVGKASASNLQKRWHHMSGMNFTTWYGRGSGIHALREGQSIVVEHARARGEWFSNLYKGHSRPEIDQAFLLAQRPDLKQFDAYDPKVLALAEKFTDYFENILGSSKALVGARGTLQAMTDLNGTVAFRSQMIMGDVNRQLKSIGSPFQFKNYADAPWTASWERINPAKDLKMNPIVFMYQLDMAVQRTLLKYNLVDNFSMEFGRRFGESGFDDLIHTHSLAHLGRVDPALKFPKEAAIQFQKLIDDFDQGPWRPGTKGTQMASTGLRKWKSAVTIYYPSHHIRNLIGDSWLMWMSGINDPRVFTKALRVVGSQRSRYRAAIGDPDLDVLARFHNGRALRIGPDGQIMMNKRGEPLVDVGWAMTEGRSVITNKFKSNISADEYYGEALSRGLLLDASKIEDLAGDTLQAYRDVAPSKLKEAVAHPAGGKIHNAASKVAETREHYARLAHLIGYVEKNMTRQLGAKLAKTNDPVARSELLKPLLDDAAREVRKWHPDGTDLTYFEQKYMRNIMPFYSWTRKAIPLTIEGVMMSPNKALLYPRANFAAQGVLGTEGEGPYEPLPTDQLFPDWVRAQSIGPLGDPESENPFARWFGKLGRNQITPLGTERGYTLINPGGTGIPVNSLISETFGMGTGPRETLRSVGNQASPFGVIPAELILNTTGTGAKIAGEPGSEGYASYAMGQVPQTVPLQRLFGIGKDPQEGTEPGFNWEAFINMLSAAGIQGTGKYTKSAEFDERDRRRKQKEEEGGK